MRNRLASIWSDINVLGEKISMAIFNAIQEYDRPGWIRGNNSNDNNIVYKDMVSEILQSLNLQKEIRSKNELTEKWGIFSIYKARQNMNMDCDIDLVNAKKQFDIIAFGLKSFRDSQDKLIKQRVNEGLKMRILSMNPDGEFIRQRSIEEAEREVIEATPDLRNTIMGLENWVKSVNKTIDNKKNHIELKYYNCMTLDFYYRLDDVLYIGPYWYKKTSQQTVSYKFVKGEMFELYEDYFESLWNDDRLTVRVTE
jgi:hypothetical protein